MIACSRSASLTDSAEVGSSMIRMRVRNDSALAISTSCCSPMRSEPTSVAGEAMKFKGSSSSAAAFICRRRSTKTASLTFSAPRKMFSATVMPGTRLSSWWMIASPCSVASRVPVNLTGRPSIAISPSYSG